MLTYEICKHGVLSDEECSDLDCFRAYWEAEAPARRESITRCLAFGGHSRGHKKHDPKTGVLVSVQCLRCAAPLRLLCAHGVLLADCAEIRCFDRDGYTPEMLAHHARAESGGN